MKTTYKLILLVILTCLCSILIYYLVDKVKPVKEVEDIFISQNKQELLFLSDSKNYTAENPKIILNPYGNSPLSALIIFETKDLTTPTITIKGKTENASFSDTFTPGKKHFLPIYGLYPGINNEILLTVNEKTIPLYIKTEPLPEYIKEGVVNKQSKENNFYILASENEYPVAYDGNGNVRWYLTEKYRGKIKKLENGHILLGSARPLENDSSVGLIEMDFLGKIYYEYRLEDGYHDDSFEMKNGNILAVSGNGKVVEISRENGNIVKQINFHKLLKESNYKKKTKNWFYHLSIWYDEKTNSLTVTNRDQNIVMNIDYNTEEINWIFGNMENWNSKIQKYFLNTSVGNVENAIILENGNLFILENNKSNIYQVNQNKKTVTVIEEFIGATDMREISDSQYLFLSNKENINEIYEMNHNQESFKMSIPKSYNSVIKMNLYENNKYIPSIGTHLGSLKTSETIKNPFILWNKENKQLMEKYHLRIQKESDRLRVEGTWKEQDNVKIILDSLFHKKTYQVNNKHNKGKVVTTFINDNELKGKYYLYIKINNTVYDINQYIEY